MLRVKGISKKFGELQVLSNVSLDVNKGERVGIIGPNGAGKTTLFNIISGFTKPDSGEVIFKGMNVVGFKPSKLAKLGLVRTFQIVRIFENMTVEENLLTISSDPSILKEFGLWDKRGEMASNLSYGELRKLSIALAMAAKPELLLLDEPFSGLSKKEAHDLANIIKELGNNGNSMVIIEHRLGELFDVAERVVVLNSGKVIFDGHPDEVVKQRQVIEAYLGRRYAKG